MAGKKKRRNRRQKILEEDSEAKLLERIAKIKALLEQEDVDEDDPQNYYHFTDSSDEEKLESQKNKRIRLGSSYSSTIRSLSPESETYDEVNIASVKHSMWEKQPFYCSLVNPLASTKYPHTLKNYIHPNEMPNSDVSRQDEKTNISPEVKEANIDKNILQTLKKTPTELTFSACVSIAAGFPDEALMSLKCLQIPLLQNQIEYQPEIITIEDSNSENSRRASEEREIKNTGEKGNNSIIDLASVSSNEKISEVLANYLDAGRFHTNIKTASTYSDKSTKPSVEELDDRNKQTVDFGQEIEKFLIKLRMIKMHGKTHNLD